MSEDSSRKPGFTLSRWSRRKLEASRAASAPTAVEPIATSAATATPAAASSAPAAADTAAAQALPAIESLTFDSDFAAFMRPDVDAALRRMAVKKLVRDPRFNVMDGLDIYIDDYSKPAPLPAGFVDDMLRAQTQFTDAADALARATSDGDAGAATPNAANDASAASARDDAGTAAIDGAKRDDVAGNGDGVIPDGDVASS